MIEICPSILSADFSRLGENIHTVDLGGADQIHLDVMDGHFVPNITFGPPLIKSIRPVSSKPYWAHLMISEPEKYIKSFIKAGVDGIVIHAEVKADTVELCKLIHDNGCDAGISLNPATPIEVILKILKHFERALIMTVNPGFGGQKFMSEQLDKIVRIRENYGNDIDVEVDGGIDVSTAPMAVKAGANMLVAGSAIFRKADPVAAMTALRRAAEDAEQILQ
ncbi:ribulose-phosphate 3-epimerase [bacterium]|nr:ribulose-phosphate 3-epimerase [bacterium]